RSRGVRAAIPPAALLIGGVGEPVAGERMPFVLLVADRARASAPIPIAVVDPDLLPFDLRRGLHVAPRVADRDQVPAVVLSVARVADPVAVTVGLAGIGSVRAV